MQTTTPRVLGQGASCAPSNRTGNGAANVGETNTRKFAVDPSTEVGLSFWFFVMAVLRDVMCSDSLRVQLHQTVYSKQNYICKIVG